MIRSMFAEKNRLKNEEIIKKVQGLSDYCKFTHEVYGRIAVEIDSSSFDEAAVAQWLRASNIFRQLC